MKKVLSKVGKWFLESNSETVIKGIDTVGKNRLNKKKVALVVTAILAILLLCGVISEETFIKLFSEIN
ncbi:MAG: hypothetical protein GOVbin4342_60 [Prokaryotic dsDNA virus sp.]|nr:MAG: hypothetical protein GOVbin4342_60 [Prokaryotic dsDNA virus sp.]|tara:strand:- start:2268 stop:2471 length:204 start_codon:yes stop_codon:yes gene_type:complete